MPGGAAQLASMGVWRRVGSDTAAENAAGERWGMEPDDGIRIERESPG